MSGRKKEDTAGEDKCPQPDKFGLQGPCFYLRRFSQQRELWNFLRDYNGFE
jgi:hypothetical protein